MNYDKQLTRACADRDVFYLAYGRWWRLQQGRVYRVKFDRKQPGKSRVVEVKT